MELFTNGTAKYSDRTKNAVPLEESVRIKCIPLYLFTTSQQITLERFH